MISINSETQNYILSKIAKANFFIYLFFVFFGTSKPFGGRVESIDDYATSNPVNQIVFSSLFLISVLCILPKWKYMLKFIRREKFLTLYLLWSLTTILWSNYPIVSLKRWFQLFTSYNTILAVFLYLDSSEEAFRFFKTILIIYVPVSLLSCLVIPGAIDPIHYTWRGLTVGKNYLGQAAVVCIIVWAYAFKQRSLINYVISFPLLIMSIVLLFGSRSMTSMLTFSVLIFLCVLFYFDKFFQSLNIGRFFSTIMIIFLIGILSTIYMWGYSYIEEGFYMIGKDPSFTGRTDLWVDLLKIGRSHLLSGYGFAGFWVMSYDNLDLIQLYDKYIWLPNEAHLGYLDIVLTTGFIGLGIFLLMLIYYFITLLKQREITFSFWIVIMSLILNFQESTLFFPRVLTGELFLLGYLLLFFDQLNDNSVSIQNIDLAEH